MEMEVIRDNFNPLNITIMSKQVNDPIERFKPIIRNH